PSRGVCAHVEMPEKNDSMCRKRAFFEETSRRIVIPPANSIATSSNTLNTLSNFSCDQDSLSHILNGVQYTYTDTTILTQQTNTPTKQGLNASNSKRLVLFLGQTPALPKESNKHPQCIVVPPQKETGTVMAQTSRMVLLGEKNTVMDSSGNNSKSQFAENNTTTQNVNSSKKLLTNKSSDVSSTSKSSEMYLDYLEEMELKIRYMKNDIEFKQSQILARNKVQDKSTQLKPLSAAGMKKTHGIFHSGKFSDIQLTKNAFNDKVRKTSSSVAGRAALSSVPSCAEVFSEMKTGSIDHRSKNRQVLAKPKVMNKIEKEHLNIPGYASPDKRKIVFSESSKSVPSAKKALFQKQISYETSILSASKTIVENSKAQNDLLNQNSLQSRFKLVKNRGESVNKVATNDGNLSNIKTVSCVASFESSVQKATQKTSITTHQNPARLVSKYKLKRLSPTSAVKMAPSFNENMAKSGCHPISDPLTPTSCNKKLNLISVRKTPTLKIQSAARLVSKYKLKRLSPTSALKKSPFLFHGPSYDLKKNQTVTHFSCASDTKYNASKLKLDKRNIERIKTLPGKSMMKLDRRPDSAARNKWHGSQTDDTDTISYYNDSSQFKWSRTNLQTHNLRRLKLRQTFRLTHKYSSFKMQKHVWMRVRNKTLKRNTKSLVSIGDHLYQSNKRKLTRIKRPVSSSSLQNITDSHDLYDFKKKTFHKSWRMQKMKLISLQGVHFNVDSKGKKLSRAVFAKPSTPYESKQLDTKHCDENARLAASRAVYRSIAIATAKSKKDNRRSKSQKQHCLFFGRFGKCVRGDSCPYIHDPLKVAVCTRFLRGKCDEAQCPFTHKASINKMPVCLYYLRGSCSREQCPYLHVKVNPDASVCRDFLNGFCSLGDKCKKLHSFVCPTFSFTGTCLRGVNCPMLHRQRQKDQSTNSKSSLTPSETVEKVPKQSAVKHTIVNCAKSRPIVAQPSYISLTAEQEDMTPTSQLKPPKELILKSTSLSSSNTSFISLLPSDLTVPVNDLSTRRPGFQSAPASYPLSESTLAKVSTPIVDSLKTTNTSEPVTSLKITPSFLSQL
ncbi:hypothetical protein Btru_006690, partial [Bulinus truncatus]